MMALNLDGRLPSMSVNEKSNYWGAVFNWRDSRGRFHNLYKELMADPSIGAEKKAMYAGWANEMKKY